jgi:hypothetical protein
MSVSDGALAARWSGLVVCRQHPVGSAATVGDIHRICIHTHYLDWLGSSAIGGHPATVRVV